MTVVDKYANTDLENEKLSPAAEVSGNKVVIAVSKFQIGTDEANSVYRVFPDLNPCLIPVDIKVYNEAATNGVVDIGLYAGSKGAEIDKDILAASVALGTAHAKNAGADGLASLNVSNIGKRLYEIAGHTLANRKDTYDIAFTVKTAATATGNVVVVGTFVQG